MVCEINHQNMLAHRAVRTIHTRTCKDVANRWPECRCENVVPSTIFPDLYPHESRNHRGAMGPSLVLTDINDVQRIYIVNRSGSMGTGNIADHVYGCCRVKINAGDLLPCEQYLSGWVPMRNCQLIMHISKPEVEVGKRRYGCVKRRVRIYIRGLMSEATQGQFVECCSSAKQLMHSDSLKEKGEKNIT